MTNNKIKYTHNFGGTVQQFYCPHCGDYYHIDTDNVHEGLTDCWKCHRDYLQRICNKNNFDFVVGFVHTCKG